MFNDRYDTVNMLVNLCYLLLAVNLIDRVGD